MRNSLISRVLVAALVLCTAGTVSADAAPDARTDRLSGLTGDDLKRLTPYAAAGPVALVEFADTDADELPGINVLSRIAAPIDTVLSVVETPTAYPRFMHTLDRVETISQRAGSQVYDWAWDLSVFSLSGRNIMRVYRGKPGSNRGHRVTIDSVAGDFGTGRIRIRLLPSGDKHTLMVISLRLDLRNANYIARQAAEAARSVNRSANMALAYAMTFGLGREAEWRVGVVRAETPMPAIQRPNIPPGLILPLLDQGDLVFLHMNGDKLTQASVFGRVNRPQPEVRPIMLNPQDFGAALVPGSQAEVVSRSGAATTFNWEIAIPLLGVSGQMRMTAGNPIVTIDATQGALAGGQWAFDAQPINPHSTLVSAWARFDVEKTNFVVRAITAGDPFLAHGITAASQVMLVRALRTRARDLFLERFREQALKNREAAERAAQAKQTAQATAVGAATAEPSGRESGL